MMNRKDFRKLSRWLYQLPELIPEREMQKYENIWVEKYGHNFSIIALAKSNVNMKELLSLDIRTVLRRKRRK